MAETLGNNQEALHTAPQDGDDGDAGAMRAELNAGRSAGNAHDNDYGIHVQSSTLALRGAGAAGKKWMTVDDSRHILWYHNGVSWLRDTTFQTDNGQPPLFDAGNSGVGILINWANGPVQKVTVTAACTLTFTGATAGATYTLLLVQNGTGGYAVTLPGWDFGDNTPTYNTNPNKKSLVSALYDGSEYIAALGNTGS